MILVTLGTIHFPFERVLRALDGLTADEALVVQTRGGERPPAHARVFDDLPYDELVGHIRDARVVVCHAGVGSVLTALANGKVPVVVPRLARYGEAVDDHQLPFARRLAERRYVRLVVDPAGLPEAIAAPPVDPPAQRGAGTLATDLRSTLAELLGYSR